MDTPAVPATPEKPTVTLPDLIKLALDTAKAVEAVYPAGTPGADKFAAVMTLVNEFAPLATVAASIVETVVPVFVNFAVAEWNKLGVFVHSVESSVSGAATPAA
jgi:hypothetical protein